MTRFTLEKGKWYGMTMYPGYGDTAYHSPIRMKDVRPLKSGAGRLDIDFFNAAYAQGVQDFTYRLRTLKRGEQYMLAAIEETDRAISLVPCSLGWMKRYFPDQVPRLTDIMANTDSFSVAMGRLTGSCPHQ